eukprot:CAMPEP_0178755648 /NCGR_PEP_ID=MMETSP0744-20121128/12836_1 /TAXON_ID=913974 /ORGANISM="Nitzschia punctata, Strain CCMP561" /LENGTH=393 /DNA_ID=CAMNT_0020409703 /DNA_START=186 /DNA_END=1367 /DNA_ORIENTATION=-
MRARTCNPIYAVLLTLGYVFYCLILGLILPKCIVDGSETSECGTEGYDNSVISWATDFFLAAVFGVMSILLTIKTYNGTLTGLAYAFLCLVFIGRGQVGRWFGNSGIDDGTGQIGFYVFTLIYYFIWTLSALMLAFLVHAAWDRIDSSRTPLHCGLIESRILFGLVVLSFLVISTGCIWSALALWDTSNDVVDDEPTDNIPGNMRVRIALIRYGQLIWHGMYCAFLITATSVWRAFAKQKDVIVGGLTYSFAAFGILLFQAVIIGILIYFALEIANENKDWRETNATLYTTIVFNYSMLMTGYFIQSFFFSLFPAEDKDRDIKDSEVFAEVQTDDEENGSWPKVPGGSRGGSAEDSGYETSGTAEESPRTCCKDNKVLAMFDKTCENTIDMVC